MAYLGQPQYTILAVQYYAAPEIVANVPPNCFMPRPNVGSAVICLTRHAQPPVDVADERLMFSADLRFV